MAFTTDMFTGCDGLFICIAQWANEVTEGAFWTIMTLGLGMVVFLATTRYGVNRAFGFAAFMSGSISLTLIFLGLMQWYVGSIFIALLIIGIIAMRMMER